MPELTLEWQEAGSRKTETISDRQATKNPGTVRIGRDPAQCDLIVSHDTVSRLHVEIFFSIQQNQFFLRNLKQTNPPVVDGRRILQGEALPLNLGTTIRLGKTILTVTSISIVIPKTVVAPPQPSSGGGVYQLKCPNPHCGHLCPYEWIEIGCQWCGTSLVAAASILILPEQ